MVSPHHPRSPAVVNRVVQPPSELYTNPGYHESSREQLVHATDAKNRGVKHAPFVVLIGTKVPAILVEVGFITYAPEAQKLITETYQRQIAEAIANGIEKYATGLPSKL